MLLGVDRRVAVRVVDVAAHHGDPLDDLRDALQEQQEEAEWDQRLGRPLRQAAGVAGLLVLQVGGDEERHAVDDHQDHERHQEQAVAEQVDPVAYPLGQAAVDDIDADMLVLEQGVGGAQHEHGAEQLPLRFEPGVGADVEHLADDRIAGRDQDCHQDQPIDGLADGLVQPIDCRCSASVPHPPALPPRNHLAALARARSGA